MGAFQTDYDKKKLLSVCVETTPSSHNDKLVDYNNEKTICVGTGTSNTPKVDPSKKDARWAISTKISNQTSHERRKGRQVLAN